MKTTGQCIFTFHCHILLSSCMNERFMATSLLFMLHSHAPISPSTLAVPLKPLRYHQGLRENMGLMMDLSHMFHSLSAFGPKTDRKGLPVTDPLY